MESQEKGRRSQRNEREREKRSDRMSGIWEKKLKKRGREGEREEIGKKEGSEGGIERNKELAKRWRRRTRKG